GSTTAMMVEFMGLYLAEWSSDVQPLFSDPITGCTRECGGDTTLRIGAKAPPRRACPKDAASSEEYDSARPEPGVSWLRG
ncbi:MAG TPA: hypothetical protein PKM25_16235, partial [Candidatus Ozemobacteraceae bacterium]|nr:hypothetical protein [Candidatus Ozemobacteraceae bacterium]